MTASSTPLLFDTDVLIDYLRGRTEAVDYIDNLSAPLFVSVITVAELYGVSVTVPNERNWMHLSAPLVSFRSITTLPLRVGFTGAITVRATEPAWQMR
jgi:predicted nucleic acid-binding protein